MGTRSRIGIELEDGTIKSVYCHWDGYPSHNGKILKEHYNSAEKAHELINMGDISSLREKIGNKHDFMNGPDDECIFYHRDRGDDWEDTQPVESNSRDEFLNLTSHTHGEYAYLFTNKGWLFSPLDDLPLLKYLSHKDIGND